MREKTYTPDEIEAKFNALPEDIQGLVYGADMLKTLDEIGKKFQLHIDQLSIVESETADVMTGYSQPDMFAANLAKGLDIDQTKAEGIAKDINDQLFVKIRESLRKLYEQPGSGAIINPPYTPPQSEKEPDIVLSPKPEPEKPVISAPIVDVAPPISVTPTPAAPVLNLKVETPPLKPAVPEAQEVLSAPVISAPAPAGAAPKAEVPKEEPPAPGSYKTDPYREVPE